MFSRSCRIAALSMLLSISAAWALPPAAVFHVAPSGNDRAVGDAAHPFASLARAARAVQDLRSARPGLTDTVLVLLHGGRYFLNAPLHLGSGISGSAGSPTLVAAAPGETPVLSGGAALGNWTLTTLDGKNVWVAALPAQVRRSNPDVRELWVNGERRSPARFPDSGYLSVDSIPEITPSMDWMEGQRSFVAKSGTVPPKFDLTGAQVVLSTKWVESYLPVSTYEPASRTFRFARRSVFRIDPGDVYYIQSARGALNTPGEWWLDERQGKIYYLPMPGEDTRTIDAVVPVLEQLMRIDGEPEKGGGWNMSYSAGSRSATRNGSSRRDTRPIRAIRMPAASIRRPQACLRQ